MHPTRLDLFDRYRSVLQSTTAPVTRDHRLLLAQDGDVAAYYAPFDYVNSRARIVLVGITPGPTQMAIALHAARDALQHGATALDAVRIAKQIGAFSGEPLRGNLLRQLEHWGLHHWLGLRDAAALFGSAAHLVQTTSLLRYPVFVRGQDYRGSPDMHRHPLLRSQLLEHFVREAQSLPDALFFPLGPKVQQSMARLVAEGLLPARSVLPGLLHPSGNNTYRIQYLLGDRRTPPPHMTRCEDYDAGRARFRRQYLDTAA